MKYLITESQFDKVVFKYLDNQDFIKIERKDKLYFVNSEGDSIAQITFNKMNNECYINWDLNKEISSFFSLKQSNSNQIIGSWVEDTIQMNVYNVTTSKTSSRPQLRIPRN